MPKPARGHSRSTAIHHAVPYPTAIPSGTAAASASASTPAPTTSRHSRIPSRFNMSSTDSSPQSSKTSNSTWSNEADKQLIEARAAGLNWTPISATYFPDKTPNACRKRHERLMVQRHHSQDWNGVKLDQLAKGYDELREQMWTLLANRVGEKWQTVEAKCMEKGFKNLQVANRTSRRRENLAATTATPSQHPDSPSTHDPGDDRGLGHELTHTPSNYGDEHSSHHTPLQALQQHPSPFLPFQQQPQSLPPPPQPHLHQHHQQPFLPSQPSILASSSQRRDINYPISSSSASSSAASPTFTAPSDRDRTWSFSSAQCPPSKLLQAWSPSPPQPVQPPPQTMTMGNYTPLPSSTGGGLPTIASILRGGAMEGMGAVTTT